MKIFKKFLFKLFIFIFILIFYYEFENFSKKNLTIENLTTKDGMNWKSEEKIDISFKSSESFHLYDYLKSLNYYRDLKISKSSNDGICKLPVLVPWNEEAKKLIKPIEKYNKCKKNSPLSYVTNKRLFINQTVNETYYSGKITHCKYAKVIRTAIEKEYYVLSNYSIINLLDNDYSFKNLFNFKVNLKVLIMEQKLLMMFL